MEVLEAHENQKGIIPLIELAPYQRCFRASGMWRDPLVATMGNDPAYVSFLKSLNEDCSSTSAAEEPVMSLDEWIEAKASERALPPSNALLKYLKEKHQQGGGKGGGVRGGGAGVGKEKKSSHRKASQSQKTIQPTTTTTSISSSSSIKNTPAASSSGKGAVASASSLQPGTKPKHKRRDKGILLCSCNIRRLLFGCRVLLGWVGSQLHLQLQLQL